MELNRKRGEQKPGSYFSDEQMRALIQNRDQQAAQDALKQSVYNMHELSEAMNSAGPGAVANEEGTLTSQPWKYYL